MTKEILTKIILEELPFRLERKWKGINISHEKIKSSKGSYDGLIIMYKNKKLCPVLNLDECYKEYSNKSKYDIIADLLNFCEKNFNEKDVDFKSISDLYDYEKVKPYLYASVVQSRSDVFICEHIEKIPVAVKLLVNDFLKVGEDNLSITATVHDLKNWGIDKDMLISGAKENTEKLFPTRLTSLGQAIGNQNNMLLNEILVCTNANYKNGAINVFLNNNLQKISKAFNRDLLIIPASIHETLIIPDIDNKKNYLSLLNAISKTNKEKLRSDEILGDFLLKYEQGSLRTISKNDMILSEDFKVDLDKISKRKESEISKTISIF